ncbi:MAG: hypothetical protein ACPGVO_02665 [Spirulinaceae cyanobacterium]
MSKLKQQFQTVNQLLFSPETGQTYRQALGLTGQLLREIAQLVWLVLCFMFLITFWGGRYAGQASYNLRQWYGNLDAQQRQNIVGSLVGSVQAAIGGEATPGESSGRSLIELAKSQLGITQDPPALQPIPTVPTVTVDATAADEERPEVTEDITAAEPESTPEPEPAPATVQAEASPTPDGERGNESLG